MSTDSYDDIPYDSTPFAETHPDHLCVLGRLFGLPACPPGQARVLELGCASGGNIVPMAWYSPGMRITGIERSPRQAALARELVGRLGLANIDIRQDDIMDAAPAGPFDYIVAHGIYSWVPAPVRSRILTLAAQTLADDGILYLSYNTLPGWRMRGMLRDMLLHHARGVAAPRERLAKAYELFDLLERATSGLDALAAKYLRAEIASLRRAHPSYLYHEYMEDINQPFLFSEFMAEAARHGLQYLCDVELGTAFPSALGDAAEAALTPIEGLLELEQTMDFVRCRNFRRSLLCRAERELTREIALERFGEYAFSALLGCRKKIEFARVRSQSFTAADGHAYDVSHPLTKAALLHLAASYPDTVAFDELAAAARESVRRHGGGRHAEETNHLYGELFSLFAHQAVRASPQARRHDKSIGERPRLHALARAQAALGLGHLASVRHTTVSLDAFAAHLARLADGTRGVPELVEAMTSAIAAGEVTLAADARKSDPARLAADVRANVERLLALFAHQGLLEADAAAPGRDGAYDVG